MSAEAVHQALKGYLDEGEIALRWVLTIDVAGPDNQRYLAHRAGGGIDGTDMPQAWEALGMLQSATDVAREQLKEITGPFEDDDEAAE